MTHQAVLAVMCSSWSLCPYESVAQNANSWRTLKQRHHDRVEATKARTPASRAEKFEKVSSIALSTAEAEFISASAMVQEVIYLRKFLGNLGFPQTAPTPVFADNETCIAWSVWTRLVPHAAPF